VAHARNQAARTQQLNPNRLQCPADTGKPLTVGASGSHIVTTKLRVPNGKPLQESCGETSWPPAPKMPLTCGIASFSPSFRSLLVSEKEAAGGRFS
jgi:hypothetical protein